MRPAETRGAETPILILTCALSPTERLVSAMGEARRLGRPEQAIFVHGAIASDPEVDRLADPRQMRLRSKRPPTRVGPSRSCMRAETLRSAQVKAAAAVITSPRIRLTWTSAATK